MIDKQYGDYIIICDVCQETALEGFDTFQEVMDARREEGWVTARVGGEWADICPECQNLE